MKFFLIVILLFSFESLAKNCKKGIPCGNSCISVSKTCNIGGTTSHNSHNYSNNKNTQAGIVYYYINTNGINVYTSKDTKSKVRFVLNKNDKVQVISTSNIWYKISSIEGDGFILKKNKDGYNVINK